MNPWNILGWIVVAIFSCACAFLVLAAACYATSKAIRHASRTLRHLKTRNTPPQTGQRWMQGDKVLRILKTYDNGTIRIESGCASWGDSPDQWKRRVRARKLYLLD